MQAATKTCLHYTACNVDRPAVVTAHTAMFYNFDQVLCDESVCLSLSARMTRKPHPQTSPPNFRARTLLVAVARSSCDGVAIRYRLLPFTSRGQWPESSTMLCSEKIVSRRYPFDVRYLHLFIEFIRMRHWGKVYYLRFACRIRFLVDKILAVDLELFITPCLSRLTFSKESLCMFFFIVKTITFKRLNLR